MSMRPIMEDTHRITKEKLADKRWPDWGDLRWRDEEARLLEELTKKRQAALEEVEEEIRGLLV